MTMLSTAPPSSPAESRDAAVPAAPGPSGKRQRPWPLYILMTLSFLVSLWWVQWQPLDRGRLYSAIPDEATAVIEHVDFSGNWAEWAANPLVRNLILLGLESHGRSLNESALSDPRTADYVERFVGRHAVLAYAPFWRGTTDDAWILASWVGGGLVNRIRWNTLWNRIEGVEEIRIHHGERAWVMRDRSGPTDRSLSVAIVDGTLLACWSRDPLAVERLAQRKKVGAPIAAALQAKSDPEPGTVAAQPVFREARDRAWLQSANPRAYRPLAASLRLAVRAVNARGAHVWLGMEDPLARRSVTEMRSADGARWDETELSVADLAALEAVLGDRAAVLAILSLKNARQALAGRVAHRSLRALETRLSAAAAEASPFFVALLRPAYDSSTLGFRAPGLLLGMRVRNPELMRQTVTDMLDILNAGFGWGLIPKQEGSPAQAQGLIVVDSANANAFQGLPLAERPAFAVVGDWLLFAANRSVLEKTLAEPAAPAVAAWRTAAAAQRTSTLFWMDFQDAHPALLRLGALYGLLAHATQAPQERSVRHALAGAARFAHAARAMGSGRLWKIASTAGWEFEMVLGAGVEPAQP
jgi:hypothetical protein